MTAKQWWLCVFPARTPLTFSPSRMSLLWTQLRLGVSVWNQDAASRTTAAAEDEDDENDDDDGDNNAWILHRYCFILRRNKLIKLDFYFLIINRCHESSQ